MTLNTITDIQQTLQRLLPVLAANTRLANQEHAQGKCSNATWNIIQKREHTAHALVCAKHITSVEAFLLVLSPIMIDLETGLRDQPDPVAQADFDALEATYAKQGFKKGSMGVWWHADQYSLRFQQLISE